MNELAKTIKRELSRHLMTRLNYFAVHEEYENHYGRCDVYGITKAGYGIEFEVKTSKSDLMGEIRTIMAILDKSYPEQNCKKVGKHRDYLVGSPSNLWRLPPPSKFIFVVTEELVEIALPIIGQTPYGLWAFNMKIGPAFSSVKAPENLHKDRVTQDHIRHLLRSLSYRLALQPLNPTPHES